MMPVFLIAYGGLALATVLALWRLLSGPTVLDRLLAFDAIVVLLASFLIVASMQWRTDEFLELILILTSLGFFTTVVFYHYLHRLSAETVAAAESNDRRERR